MTTMCFESVQKTVLSRSACGMRVVPKSLGYCTHTHT